MFLLQTKIKICIFTLYFKQSLQKFSVILHNFVRSKKWKAKLQQKSNTETGVCNYVEKEKSFEKKKSVIGASSSEFVLTSNKEKSFTSITKWFLTEIV